MIVVGQIVELIAALGVGAALSALISGFFNRRKTNADTAETIGRIWKGLVDEYRTQVENLEERMAGMENSQQQKDDRIVALEGALRIKDEQIRCLEEEIEELRKFIHALGKNPPPRKKAALNA